MKNFNLGKELISLVKSYARDMKILVAEDNSFDVEFYRALFGKNFKVFDVAQNGKEAIELFKSKPKGYYDLIVTDVDMPIMNGLELIKEIRNCSLLQSIIVLTGVDDLRINQNISFYYIDGLLPKPVDSEKLYALLYRVLKRVSDEKDYNYYVELLEENYALHYADKLKNIVEKLGPVKELNEVEVAIELLNELIGSKDELVEKIDKYSEPEIDFIDDEFFDFESEDVESVIEQMHLVDHEKITAKEFMNKGMIDSDLVYDVKDILEEFKDGIYHIEGLNEEYLEKFERVIVSFVTVLNLSSEFKDIAHGLEKLYANVLGRLDLQKVDKDFFRMLFDSIIEDLSKFVKEVLIEQSALDIHYLDASLFANISQIEMMLGEK